MTVVLSVLVDQGSFLLVEGLVCFKVTVQAVSVFAGIELAHTGRIAGGEMALDGAIPFLEFHEPHVVVGIVAAVFFIVSEESHEAGASHEEEVGVGSFGLTFGVDSFEFKEAFSAVLPVAEVGHGLGWEVVVGV